MMAGPTRLRHLLGWVAVLAALAWWSTTDAGRRLDGAVAAEIARLRGAGPVADWAVLADAALRPLALAPATLALAAVLWWRFRRFALLVPASFATSIAVTYLLKWALGRPRPAGWLAAVDLGDAAFPSAHVAGASATVIAVLQLLRRVAGRLLTRLLQAGALALVAAVAAARVWVGAHWLGDVVAGLVVGVIGVSATLLVLRALPAPRGAGPRL